MNRSSAAMRPIISSQSLNKLLLFNLYLKKKKGKIIVVQSIILKTTHRVAYLRARGGTK